MCVPSPSPRLLLPQLRLRAAASTQKEAEPARVPDPRASPVLPAQLPSRLLPVRLSYTVHSVQESPLAPQPSHAQVLTISHL